MSIRPTQRLYNQSNNLSRMEKLRQRAQRWNSRLETRRQAWADKRAARIERWNDAFRGSWITKIGLGMLAIWNAITNPPIEIVRRQAPIAPYMMMGLPFMLRKKSKDSKKKKRNQPRYATVRGHRFMAETLEQRQLLAADVSMVDLQAGSDTGQFDNDEITMTTLPTIDVTYNNLNTTIGETIEIRDTDGSGTLLGSAAPATASGTVSITLTTALSEGLNDLFVQSGLGSGVPMSIDVTLDTMAPTLDSITTDDALITDADIPGPLMVSFNYNEDMDTDVIFGFSPGTNVDGTSFVAAVGGPPDRGWSDSDTFFLKYTTLDGDEEVPSVTFDVGAGSLPTDVAGNPLVPVSGVATTPITAVDTLNPTVVITSDKGTMGDTILFGETATITFTLSEDSTTFETGDATVTGGILGPITGSGSVYMATYTPPAATDGTEDVNVAIATFMDIPGNDNEVAASLTLDIDTVKPVITSLTLLDTDPDFDEIDEDDISGSGQSTLRITFNEVMDSGVTPTVTPQNDLGTLASVDSEGWLAGDMIYQIVYNLADTDAEVDDVEFDVSLAQDVDGNVMDPVDNMASGTEIDTFVETVTFTVNDSSPQEDLLPLSPTLINAEVTFTVDDEASDVTTITYMIGDGGVSDTATAGVDYEVEGATLEMPDPMDPTTWFYMGTVMVQPGDTTEKVDINILSDLLWEGDETFTVKITDVTNPSETVVDGSTPAVVTIEDNETGAEVTIMAPDNMASESYNFQIGDDAVSGDPIFNSDIVANDGDTSATPDPDQDEFETPVGANGENSIYVTQSLADALGGAPPAEEGLPDNGMLAPTAFGPGAVLSYNNDDNGLNARLSPQGPTPDVFNIPVVNKQYSQIHLFGAAAEGTAAVSVRFFYTSGAPSAVATQTFEDWRTDISVSQTPALYNAITGRDTANTDADTLGDTEAVSIFGSTFLPDPSRILDYVEVSVNTSDATNVDGGTFAFLGATGVAESGTMGQFAVKIDVPLDEDVDIELDTTNGDAVNGVDYELFVESSHGSGMFDTSLGSGGTVTVTIPAGETETLVKLTVIDDMITEGGIIDSFFGSEDATLEVISVTPDAGPTPDVGTPDNATVQIKDDDAAKFIIEAVEPDAAEGGDSGEFKVTLEKKDTSQTGMTTSSTDTIITVDITGEAVPGLDYQTSIDSDGATDATPTTGDPVAISQRVDGFWSLQDDPDIANANTWAHNTVRKLTGSAGYDYYEVVLYQSGRISADIDHTSAFNSHVRILSGGQDIGDDAIVGNNIGNGGAGGSPSNVGAGNRDALATTGTIPAGTYYIEVSRHDPQGDTDNEANDDKFSQTDPLDAADLYTLNISILNHDEGILVPAGQSMTSFKVDPIDDMIVEGGQMDSFGTEDVEFTMTGFTSQADPDLMIMAGMDSATVDILDNDEADLGVTGVTHGHEDPLSTPTGVAKDGKFTLELSKESSTDTKVKFTVNGFNTAAPTMGVPQVGDDATYGDPHSAFSDYFFDLTQDAKDDGFVLNFDDTTGMGFITIPAGETLVDLIVVVNNQDIIEDDEEVRIEFSTTSPPNMLDPDITVSPTEATVMIFDEDLSEVAINDTAFAEEGGQNGVFTVSLDSPKTSDTHTDIKFMVMIADTAPEAMLPPGGDYDISTTLGDVQSFDPSMGMGVVRIPAYKGAGQIIVLPDDDTLIELTEHIKIKLVEVIPGSADSNIQDIKPGFDDAEIELRDNDSAFIKITGTMDGEENNGGSPIDGSFTVSLVDAAGDPAMASFDIDVTYTTLASSTANPGPVADGFNVDYMELSGLVTIPMMTEDVDVPVVVFEDIVNEQTETVNVQLSGPTSGQIVLHPMASMRQGTVNILDDDEYVVTISASDPMAREGNDDGQYLLELSGFSDSPVVVDLAAVLGTLPGPDATPGTDYTLAETTVTFQPFELAKTVDLLIVNDSELEEFIEHAEVEVDNLISANPGISVPSGTATVFIKPDPTVSVFTTDMMGMEGADDAEFRITLPEVQDISGPTGAINLADGDLKVTFELRGDASEGPLPDDYQLADANGILTGNMVVIPQGDGFVDVRVVINDDMVIEDLEHVTIMIKDVQPVDPLNTGDSDVEVAKFLYSVDPNDALLRTVNTDPSDTIADGTTDSSVPLTATGFVVEGAKGIAVDPFNHDVYVILDTDSVDNLLAVVNPATGIAERIVGDLGGDFRGLEFVGPDMLKGIRSDATLFDIDTADATTSSPVSLTAVGGETDGIGFNPLLADLDLYHVTGDTPLFEGQSGGTVSLSGSSVTNAAALEHVEKGNFAGNSFFVGENVDGGSLYTIDFDGSTAALDAVVNLFGTLDAGHQTEGLAFIKSNAFVQIKDNDSGFIEVKAKDKGDDSLNADVDTGFTVTIRKPDGTTATTSDTDTTVSFSIMNTATPFLGAQSEGSNSEPGTSPGPQDIDTFNGSTGGADNWSPNGSGVPHTIVNGSGSGMDWYSFTILNDGDDVTITSTGSASSLQLLDAAGNPISSGSSINETDLDAGTYVVKVTAGSGSYSLDVAVENHLIADYQLIEGMDAQDLTLTSSSGGMQMWEVTIPADTESIMLTVDVFNDTQVEDLETVSLWLKSVEGGDADIHTGLVYFADDASAPVAGVGRTDVGGSLLEKVVTNMPSGVDPFGISIDAAEGKVYWSSNSSPYGIFRANLDGSDVETVVTLDSASDPRGIEVAGDHVYWVDDDTAEVQRINKDGSGPILNIVDVPEDPSDLRDIAVDLGGGKVYFSDEGLDRILRVNLDGTDLEVIVNNIGDPHSIALDLVNGKIYWTNDSTPGPVEDSIQRANLDGSDIELVADLDGDVNDGSGIAVDTMNNYVYVSIDGNEIVRVPLGGTLPAAPEFVSDIDGLVGSQDLNHIDLLIPTMIHATAEICDRDEAIVFVSSDNKLAEAALDPARESNPTTHKDIVVSLRDANGTPVTSQTATVIDYDYLASSTANNGTDFAMLDGDVEIPAGSSSAALDNTLNSIASVFVFNDGFLEGDETAEIALDAVSSGDPEITIVAPNADMEDMGVVLIKDDESATVSVAATDEVAKEADGTDDDPFDPGKFTFTLTQTSSSLTTVEFEIDTPTDAEDSDYVLDAPAGNNLQDLGGGKYSVDIKPSEFTAMVFVNVVQDSKVEPNETVAIKITDVTSATNANINPGSPDTAEVTIYDDDVAKVIITNNGDATESTQPSPATPSSPGESGQFKVSMVDLDGNMVDSETDTTVKVFLDTSAIGTDATYGEDFEIPGFVESSPGAGDWHTILTFSGSATGTGETMKTLDVDLLPETPPLDMGDEYVKLTLDPTYDPDATDPSDKDGVVGDDQIELDVTGGLISFTFDPSSPCDDFTVDGMDMDMAEVKINDEQFKINIDANDTNADEPGTLPTSPGNNGQFTISISNPWQFGDTIVNYKVTGTATTGVDYDDLDGYDPTDADFISVSIEGQAVIPAGDSSVLLDVLVIDDELIELDPETVTVMLLGLDDESTGAVENDSMVGVRMLGTTLTDTVNIFDDDSATAFASVSDSTANEPNSPTDNGQFEISLREGGSTGPTITSISDTTVKFQMSGDAILGGAGAADFTSGADYKLVLDGSTDDGTVGANEGFSMTYDPVTGMGEVTIPAGKSTVKINVVTLNDWILEDNEKVILTPVDITAGEPSITASGDMEMLEIEDTDKGEVKLIALDDQGSEPGPVSPDASYRVFLVQEGTTQRLVSDTETKVTYEVKGTSTADEGIDFFDLGTMITIPAFTGGLGDLPDLTLGGDGEAIIGVEVKDDDEIEPTETVDVGATDVMGDDDIELHSMASMIMASVDILDDDEGLVSIKSDTPGADDDAAEVNPPGTPNDGKFEVLLDTPSATETVVTYMVVDGSTTADYGDDYTLSGATSTSGPIMGTVTIGIGDTSATIDLTVVNDFTTESLENVTVKLVSTDNAAIDVDTTMMEASIDIVDDDVPTFTVSSPMVDESAGEITFKITLDQPIDQDVDVFLNFEDQTATGKPVSVLGTLDPNEPDEDYDSDNTSPPVTFPANGTGMDLMRTITIDINDDNWVEKKEETFLARLIVDGGSLADPTNGLPIQIVNGVGTIKDDDIAVFTIFEALGDDTMASDPDVDPTITEGTDSDPYAEDAPLMEIKFEVELSNPIDTDVDVDVKFNSGDATGGVFGVAGGLVATPLPTFGTDYDDETQTVTFTSGESGMNDRKEVSVWVIKDQIVEGGPTDSFGSETFTATLEPSASDLATGNPTMERMSDATDDSEATIVDDDEAKVFVKTTDFEASEVGHSPDFGDGEWTISLTNPSDSDTVVKFTMSGEAELGVDYSLSAPMANMLTPLGNNMFSVKIPGSGSSANTDVVITLEPISVPVLAEDDELATLTLNEILESDVDIMIDDTMDSDDVRINDGDAAIISIKSDVASGGDPDASETVAGSPADNGKFVIFQSEESDSDTFVEFMVTLPTTPPDPFNDQADPSAQGGGNPADYSLEAGDPSNMLFFDPVTGKGTIKIPAGDTMAMLNVIVNDDAITEGDEEVSVMLTGTTSNADVVLTDDPTMDDAVVTIGDNGDGIFVQIKKIDDGDEPGQDFAGGADGKYEITLRDGNGNLVDWPSTTPLSVSFTVGGSATPGVDYVALNSPIDFSMGDNTKELSVDVSDDMLVEPTEDVVVNLTVLNASSVSTSLGTTSVEIMGSMSMATVDITDDDVAVFTIESTIVSEDAGTIMLEVSLNKPIFDVDTEVTVSYADNTALAGVDYNPVGPQTLVFPAGSSASQFVMVEILDDSLPEPQKFFETNLTVTPLDPPGDRMFAPPVIPAGAVIINDDDALNSSIQARHAFYNSSVFDGLGAGVDGPNDSDAIATDKEALLPGGIAEFKNYTTYSRGFNGAIIDISSAPGPITVADFEFRVGNDNNPAGWALAPAPITPIQVIPGGGVGGSDRIVIKWADNAIEKEWLQIRMLANANTGLATDEVHYWGNRVGETGDDPFGAVLVNSQDLLGVLGNTTLPGSPLESIDNNFDFNRDGFVNSQDLLEVLGNTTLPGSPELNLINPPSALVASESSESAWSDSVDDLFSDDEESDGLGLLF